MSDQATQSVPSDEPAWRFWIDTGGTFTDCCAIAPDGRRLRLKTLSSGRLRARVVEVRSRGEVRIDANWLNHANAIVGFHVRRAGADAQAPAATVESWRQSEQTLKHDRPDSLALSSGDVAELFTEEPAPIITARLLTRTPFPHPLPPMRMRLATTRGTNALLERTVAPVALFVTQGFADILEIGDQRRPDLFELRIIKPAPMHKLVVEVPERLDEHGEVIAPLDVGAVRVRAVQALRAGVRDAAVALLHSWANPAHERDVAKLLRLQGFQRVSLSSELSPDAKLLPRARTAVVNAALTPIVGEHLQQISSSAPDVKLHVMTSAGGLKPAESFRPVDGLLSGPAGGVIGAGAAARRSGVGRFICLDMGGTSTDVARVDQSPEVIFEHTVAGVTLLAPALRIETVAAGGGSICGIQDGRPFVGPRSAGAAPGPACYGAGGPLTITDVNLLLGRIDAARFDVPIDESAARDAFDQTLSAASLDVHDEEMRSAYLQGFLDLTNERMAEAIRRISVRDGCDPAEYTLVAFGGAGPQHACAVAELLGCRRVLIPSDASVLSAEGVGAAMAQRVAQRTLLRPLPDDEARVGDWLKPLIEQARGEAERDGALRRKVELRRLVELRVRGQAFSITCQYKADGSLRSAFLDRHRAVFGFAPAEPTIEIVALRVIASWSDIVESDNFFQDVPKEGCGGDRNEPSIEKTRQFVKSPERVDGPAMIAEPHTVIVVEPGWSARRDESGAMTLTHADTSSCARGAPATRRAVIRAELLAHRLTSIAEQMGAMLQRAALSTNVKERLDYSCCVLNEKGEVVASAPHIPVHLGAIGWCARRLIGSIEMAPGDVVVTNHPAFGGSHLPDVTVVAPVHTELGEQIGYVASRAHHAEIGGVRPGSMASGARTLLEEGAVIAPTYLVRMGETRWDEIRRALTQGPFPTRTLEENLSDLAAALAASRRAAGALRNLIDEYSLDDVRSAMEGVLERTDNAVRRALRKRAGLRTSTLETLDDGSEIRLRLRIDSDRLVVDFTGSADVHPGNLNTPPAVVRSVTAYVMRLLVAGETPINDGLLRRVEIIAPQGMLNPPFDVDPSRCPAVAGGAVETSQRIVNALVRSLSLAADSQGTMNNVIFGDDSFAYYETLAGGAGATRDAPGASAVHTHMTNTAITDPEVFEIRFPVRVARCSVRRGSGGAGRNRGGDGLIRELLFLQPMRLSVLTQHRAHGPSGADGGEDGAPGAQRIIRSQGEVVELGATDDVDVEADDRLVIETPGGGGWGAPTYPPGGV